ncbi:MAG: TatD family hydrolase [Rhizobacter sp.]|nr:TatD family hydrolase [Ferruginibacter sp.]
MIDTHCHLYADELMPDIDAVLCRAAEAGINKFYLPAIDSTTTAAMLKMEELYAGKCFAMIGLHPCSVKNDCLNELDNIRALLEQRNFAAIGETGLDFYWDTTYKKEQYFALEKQIELALKYKLPLVLHTRNAMQETIDVIKNYRHTELKGIFHCFGGSLHEAHQIIECGFLLGIGGVVTYKKSGLPEVVAEIDMQHIVLETDAPYLSPVPYRGKRNESSYMIEVAKKIAEIKNISVTEVDRITTSNAEKCFPALL